MESKTWRGNSVKKTESSLFLDFTGFDPTKFHLREGFHKKTANYTHFADLCFFFKLFYYIFSSIKPISRYNNEKNLRRVNIRRKIIINFDKSG